MDAFKIHENVISDYKSYLKYFININDERILNFELRSDLIASVRLQINMDTFV